MNEYSTIKRYVKNDAKTMISPRIFDYKNKKPLPPFQTAGNAMLITLRPLKLNKNN
jgi:hypothetical protein